ncbi:MAG: cryptochrome/photolyase family protein [Gammaproteobacteria bacterium]
MKNTLRVILGNQLFPVELLPSSDKTIVFMAEDFSLCTYVRHHRQKLVLFLAAMRSYADELERAGFTVSYHRLDNDDRRSYEDKLTAAVTEFGCEQAAHFEIEDRFMEQRLARWAESLGIDVRVEESPMFLCSRSRFAAYVADTDTPRMADFYRAERERLGLLVEADGSPSGGRWSFDKDNRRRLPANLVPPELPRTRTQSHVEAVTALVEAHFADHPGESAPFWLPTTRAEALSWLDDFLERRLKDFGPYEDAISERSVSLFHSVLSPSLNLGLITPAEVIAAVLKRAARCSVPLNSLEGFVRQVIGWREFVRGIYREFGEAQANANFWGHQRRLGAGWYTGETGVVPLDHAIRTAREYGWDHHIVRLMVVGNMMTLAEVSPKEAHRWFMEMYVDSSDWVMGPNVFGMALFSDGGIFATKPYICGSNYLLKMSDFRRGSWCDVLDGLYWRFVAKHRDFFAGNPRLSMMPRMLDRLDGARTQRIFAAAERFIDEHTCTA